ncbi:MAG: sodium:solute symporter [Bacteroidetes bacterium]|nr:sodium:solute symporter [Bacteroidota bacterium]
MDPVSALVILIGYILLLVGISFWKGVDSDNDSFFIGKKESPWYLVAFGMIGASLSGVTFLSVPGAVAKDSFSYMQMVLGYLPGYMFIAFILIPVYYKLNLTTIYGYLDERFGTASYKTGSAYFLLSRVIGAAFRIYLVVLVLQLFICDDFGIPFWATVAMTIAIIWIYTLRSGIRSIVWTDSLQTLAMLAAVIITILMIGQQMDLSISGLTDLVKSSEMSKTFFFEDGWQDSRNFWKKFLAGASMAIVMTGLDQDMMQKNLSCRNIGEAQKNVVSFSIVLVFANLLFLGLGALLYIFAFDKGIDIPQQADKLFPMIAKSHLGSLGGAIFFVGVIAAAFSSADSALTSLTTVVCVDFLNFEKNGKSESELKKTRFRVHILVSIFLFVVILAFKAINNDSVINDLFKFAGYTYGPLLGLYMLGLFTKLNLRDPLVPVVCILAPFASHGIKILLNTQAGYIMGFEFLILNGLVTFLGLILVSKGRRA